MGKDVLLSTTRSSLAPSNFFDFNLNRQVNLYIPRVSMSATYNLEDVLADMGFTGLFTQQPDFSGATQDSPQKASKVSKHLGSFSSKIYTKKILRVSNSAHL